MSIRGELKRTEGLQVEDTADGKSRTGGKTQRFQKNRSDDKQILSFSFNLMRGTKKTCTNGKEREREERKKR